mmetsp:Transcript_1876/g.4669  ORF Transcript_1876/g.4669 Transcript_1876/m.4669 type:complete len:236 (-) Transcript_1876:341-1048(-)
MHPFEGGSSLEFDFQFFDFLEGPRILLLQLQFGTGDDGCKVVEEHVHADGQKLSQPVPKLGYFAVRDAVVGLGQAYDGSALALGLGLGLGRSCRCEFRRRSRCRVNDIFFLILVVLLHADAESLKCSDCPLLAIASEPLERIHRPLVVGELLHPILIRDRVLADGLEAIERHLATIGDVGPGDAPLLHLPSLIGPGDIESERPDYLHGGQLSGDGGRDGVAIAQGSAFAAGVGSR